MSEALSAPDPLSHEQKLLRAFVEMADTLVHDYDVAGLLHSLAECCVNLLDASTAGALLMNEGGGFEVVAASDESARHLELFQLQAGQGPGLDACRTGEAVLAGDLVAVVERWPAFATEAIDQGFRSVLAMPLRLREQTIGAVDLFGLGNPLMQPGNQDIARALADIATIGILHERAVRQREAVTEQLKHALASRVVIEQAKGMLSLAGAIPMDEAFTRMRSFSRTHRQRLSTTAEDIVNGTLDLRLVLNHRAA